MKRIKEIGHIGVESISQYFGNIKERCDFAFSNKISEDIFNTLGIPSLSLDFSPGYEGEEISKEAYFSILQKTQTIEGRKLIFEECIVKKVYPTSYFNELSYTTQLDDVLRKISDSGENSIEDFFDEVKRSCYSYGEMHIFFHLLFEGGIESNDIGKNINECFSILQELRNWSTVLGKKQQLQVERTVQLLRIMNLPIHANNIISHIDLYVFIPNILSSTHGESSSTINLFSGFAKTQSPKIINSSQANIKTFQNIIGDLEYFDWIKKKKKKLEKSLRKITHSSQGQKIFDSIKDIQTWFGEKKINTILSYRRSKEKHSIGDVSLDAHVELKKTYFMVQKILENMEKGVTVSHGNVENHNASKTLKFIIGRGKVESLRPLISRIWPFFTKLGPVLKILSFIPAVRLKTVFFFVVYNVFNSFLSTLLHIPFFRDYRKVSQIQRGIPMDGNMELYDFLFSKTQLISYINSQLNSMREVKRIKRLQKEIENIEGNTDIRSSILEEELRDLQESVNQKDLEASIFDIKMEYLDILENIGEKSNKAIVTK